MGCLLEIQLDYPWGLLWEHLLGYRWERRWDS